MTIWDHLFDDDYKRRTDINQNLKRIQRLRRSNSQRAEKLTNRVDELENQVAELTLLCRSLLTVLRESETVQPEHFERVLKQLDAEDGVVDNKVTPDHLKNPDAPPEIDAW